MNGDLQVKQLIHHVIREFSSPETQKIYRVKALEGLWPTEEKIILRFFQKGTTVLDLGCGTGRTTIPLHRMEYKVIGLDITPEMIKNAKRIAFENKLFINYVIGDATDLSYPDNSFENVLFSNNGWGQIPGSKNRLKAFHEIYRVLKPKGKFVFTTHIRSIRSHQLFWAKERLKFLLFKPLGLNNSGIEYGDRFFTRKFKKRALEQNQYIHIPSRKEVQNQISIAGFRNIFQYQGSPESSFSEYAPMFYVCEK